MALWVVLFHFQPWMPALQTAHALPLPGVHVPLLRHGFLGVDFFFILSGFILAHVYGERFTAREPGLWRHFVWLRFARIWPAYIVALGVIALLKFTAFRVYGSEVLPRPPESWLGEFALHALMIQSWGFGDLGQFNVPAWSVSSEWAAYLAFPLFLWIAAGLRSNRRASPPSSC